MLSAALKHTDMEHAWFINSPMKEYRVGVFFCFLCGFFFFAITGMYGNCSDDCIDRMLRFSGFNYFNFYTTSLWLGAQSSLWNHINLEAKSALNLLAHGGCI